MNSIINDLELEYDQEDSNKENTLALTENLKKQAEELAVEYRFESWKHVDQVLYAYAKIKGFVWRLQNTYYRADGDISKKVFECSHSGMSRTRKNNNPNKTRNTTSSRVGCTCYINICWPKYDSNPCVTTFEFNHKNHNLNIITAVFAPLYRSLSESVLNRIKFYVNNSPGMEKDVINAIQRFKQNNHNEINDPDSDAFWLLEKLEIQQKDDPGMFIAKKIHQGRLFHIFWMDSNQQDLYQHYYDIIVTDNTSRTNRYQMALCENYTEFLSKFYFVRNSLNETLFNIRWEQLIELFSCTNDYLMGTLDKIKESWGKAFISVWLNVFKAFRNFFTIKLLKQNIEIGLNHYPHTNISTTSSERIFPHVIKELKKYLTMEMYFIQKAQLDISLEYNATLIPPEDYEVFEEDFVHEVNDENNQDDFAQISLRSLVDKVNRTNITEIWRITYFTHKSNSSPHFVILLCDKSHICTCLMILNRELKQWFKIESENQLGNPETCNNFNNQNQEFVDINGQSSYVKESTVLDELRNDSYLIDDINVKINIRHLYSNLFGLERKITQVASEKHRSDILNVFNEILEELYNDTNEIADESNKTLNPHIVKSKGRPQNKRYKSSVEIGTKNSGSNTFVQDNDG
ncbi:protein FAR1-related sequence 5-like [Rhizophagus clarus]|uniref:Protein FAR1-related sequence 5-like n=1 Tax=Rhizophagus clarus TaxID=94130 RepID=A0A8H3M6X8_9GLOM|nr:protein FAR1-related sequence 5-like [Rhizophagus clarus]